MNRLISSAAVSSTPTRTTDSSTTSICRSFEARLDGEEQDREQVLQHQHAERDAAGQRVELELVVEHLDDDDGAAQRHGGREIERVELAAAERNPDQQEQPERRARSSRRSAPPTSPG